MLDLLSCRSHLSNSWRRYAKAREQYMVQYAINIRNPLYYVGQCSLILQLYAYKVYQFQASWETMKAFLASIVTRNRDQRTRFTFDEMGCAHQKWSINLTYRCLHGINLVSWYWGNYITALKTRHGIKIYGILVHPIARGGSRGGGGGAPGGPGPPFQKGGAILIPKKMAPRNLKSWIRHWLRDLTHRPQWNAKDKSTRYIFFTICLQYHQNILIYQFVRST